jgi:acyl-CoA thioesterase
MEGTTGRPLVWATAQYLSFARPPEVLDLDVIVAVAGHQITQARAVGHVADREVLTVNAALGRRHMEEEGTWAVRPEVPMPEQCDPRELRLSTEGDTLPDRLQVRLAMGRTMTELPGPGTPGGRSALWARLPDVLDMSSASLAILGDYVPFGIGQALGLRAGGNSLDNTLRVGRMVPSHWVLLDVRIHQVAHGFGYGDVHLWSEDGVLLGTASQSTIVRMWPELR